LKIFDLLKKKIKPTNNTVSTINTDLVRRTNSQTVIHPDIDNLIWIENGPKRNYHPKSNRESSFRYGDVVINVAMFGMDEPSLINTKLPLGKISKNDVVDRPSYFPTYSGLLPKQRSVYWKLLSNPYDISIDIGFVFILYYGLERHLFDGLFEDAFRIILKLRDVHTNKSFQNYSAKALILSCLYHQRADMVIEFIKSLDNDFEYEMPADLLLLCYYSFDIPLNVEDIMRLSKDFEFTKNNYIKKYPEMFSRYLEDNIIAKTRKPEYHIKNVVRDLDLNKAKKKEFTIFANHSIENNTIKVPSITNILKFKKEIFEVLENTHNQVKKELSELRKSGQLPKEIKKNTIKAHMVFDTKLEKELLKELKDSKLDLVRRHFAYIGLQNFYYKYRDLDSSYKESCKDYCIKDIESLDQMQQYYKKTETKVIKQYQFKSQKEKKTEIDKLEREGFIGNIPAFKRLAIIHEKEGDFKNALKVCQTAIKYGQDSDGTKDGFLGRIKKLENKISKNNSRNTTS